MSMSYINNKIEFIHFQRDTATFCVGPFSGVSNAIFSTSSWVGDIVENSEARGVSTSVCVGVIIIDDNVVPLDVAARGDWHLRFDVDDAIVSIIIILLSLDRDLVSLE